MKYSFCPTLLEKFEYLRTNGQSKAGISNLETPAHYYTFENFGIFRREIFEIFGIFLSFPQIFVRVPVSVHRPPSTKN